MYIITGGTSPREFELTKEAHVYAEIHHHSRGGDGVCLGPELFKGGRHGGKLVTGAAVAARSTSAKNSRLTKLVKLVIVSSGKHVSVTKQRQWESST